MRRGGKGRFRARRRSFQKNIVRDKQKQQTRSRPRTRSSRKKIDNGVDAKVQPKPDTPVENTFGRTKPGENTMGRGTTDNPMAFNEARNFDQKGIYAYDRYSNKLPEEMIRQQDNFIGGRFNKIKVEPNPNSEEVITLYRAGNSKRSTGSYWSRDPPISATDTMERQAVKLDWSNSGKPGKAPDTVYKLELKVKDLPEEISMYEGKVASQSAGSLGIDKKALGGGDQIFLDNKVLMGKKYDNTGLLSKCKGCKVTKVGSFEDSRKLRAGLGDSMETLSGVKVSTNAAVKTTVKNAAKKGTTKMARKTATKAITTQTTKKTARKAFSGGVKRVTKTTARSVNNFGSRISSGGKKLASRTARSANNLGSRISHSGKRLVSRTNGVARKLGSRISREVERLGSRVRRGSKTINP